MKKSFIVVSAIFFLILPIIAILAIYFIFAINIGSMSIVGVDKKSNKIKNDKKR